MPGTKQVFRFHDHDVVACSWECLGCGRGDDGPKALIRPVMAGGRLLADLPGVAAARASTARNLARLPLACRSLFESDEQYRVEYSSELRALAERARAGQTTGARR
jgi:hypothetical protein